MNQPAKSPTFRIRLADSLWARLSDLATRMGVEPRTLLEIVIARGIAECEAWHDNTATHLRIQNFSPLPRCMHGGWIGMSEPGIHGESGHGQPVNYDWQCSDCHKWFPRDH